MPHPNQSGQAGPVPALTFLSFRTLIAIAACAMLASCAGTRGGPIPYEPQNFTAPDAPATISVDEDYKIAPLDTLHVNVFQVADLSGDYEVELGTLTAPLSRRFPDALSVLRGEAS